MELTNFENFDVLDINELENIEGGGVISTILAAKATPYVVAGVIFVGGVIVGYVNG